jgi:hypothetical protein
MLLLELDSLLEGILLVRVDYELRVRIVNRLAVSSYPDAGSRVRDTTYTDYNLQKSTTFPSRKPERRIRFRGFNRASGNDYGKELKVSSIVC